VKAILLLIIAGVAGYFVYSRYQDRSPEVIEDPVFADIRVDIKVAGRELNYLLLGKMADEEDCRTRAASVWQKVISSCKECSFQVTTCQAKLAPRYAKLFDDQAIQSTYLSFKRGSRHERDGRMVIYGLTSDEGNQLCEMLRAQFQQQYTGQVQCVKGRGG
jgi:hypothetical protein